MSNNGQMLKHQKKRNIGLINEFFARYIAKAIIEHRDSDVKKAKELFKKHFEKGTGLYKELKLFNSLYSTKVKNKEVAVTLIEQVKEFCKSQSQQKIELEKTALLHEVNISLNDSNFFNREINDYKIYATIQVLLNHWRSGTIKENLSESVQLEDKLIEHLTTVSNSESLKENKNIPNALAMTNDDVDQLVVKIMLEKLNKKFGSSLSDEQKQLINLYVFSDKNENIYNQLSTLLESIKNRTATIISKELNVKTLDENTNQKLFQVKSMLQEDFSNTLQLNDKTIAFYLAVLKLEKELNNASA